LQFLTDGFRFVFVPRILVNRLESLKQDVAVLNIRYVQTLLQQLLCPDRVFFYRVKDEVVVGPANP
jgi:hypothetical protein